MRARESAQKLDSETSSFAVGNCSGKTKYEEQVVLRARTCVRVRDIDNDSEATSLLYKIWL